MKKFVHAIYSLLLFIRHFQISYEIPFSDFQVCLKKQMKLQQCGSFIHYSKIAVMNNIKYYVKRSFRDLDLQNQIKQNVIQ